MKLIPLDTRPLQAATSIPTLLSSRAVASVLVAFVLFAAMQSAQAQVNIEQHRPRDEGTSVSLDAATSFRSGNSDLFDVSAGGQVNHRSGAHTILALARVRYGKNDGNTYASSSFGHVRYTRWFVPRVGGEAFVQLERDRFTLLQVRSLIGAGGRIEVAHASHLYFYYGSSLMLELENLDGSEVSIHPASSESVRWSNYVSLRWEITDRATLSTTVYAQPRVDEFEDIRVLQDAALQIDITSTVSFRFVLRQRFDNRPPDNIEDHDLFVENGIRVRL
jgi:putative salt-induced outer membrane protein YdiY